MTIATFATRAGAAAELTGMSAEAQRNARRHGYLPKANGRWFAYSTADLMRMRIFVEAQQLGVVPSALHPALDAICLDPPPARYVLLMEDGFLLVDDLASGFADGGQSSAVIFDLVQVRDRVTAKLPENTP